MVPTLIRKRRFQKKLQKIGHTMEAAVSRYDIPVADLDLFGMTGGL